MATRIGGGTGVIVALVVFVLSTVFLLVLTIVFYAGQTREREERASDKKLLAEVVSSGGAKPAGVHLGARASQGQWRNRLRPARR